MLCELVEENIDIIRSKQTNSVTNAKKSKSIKSQKKTVGGQTEHVLDDCTQKIINLHSDAQNFVGIGGGMDVGVDLSSSMTVVQPDNEGNMIYDLAIPVQTTNLTSDYTGNNKEKGYKTNTCMVLDQEKEMNLAIKKFLEQYTFNSKSLPKIGENILRGNKYQDSTKGITEGLRDELTDSISTFKEINLSVPGTPSMVHDTIVFILEYFNYTLRKSNGCLHKKTEAELKKDCAPETVGGV
ncbi:unnamed protein product [Mytilus coruscus]|uniref:Uncharacterized protein n=1 Tax=Mytilus coruscus TaxID=42192 RepID=A0A6J8DAK9_MYTCO|nr:unnamed protein product [Mytilus coruscus]